MPRAREQSQYFFGGFTLDVAGRSLSCGKDCIQLTIKEFETLLALVEADGSAVAKDELVAKVWPDSFVGDSSLARNISILRKHLGADSIQTVPKYGYRFALPVALVPTEQSVDVQHDGARTHDADATATNIFVSIQAQPRHWRFAGLVVGALVMLLLGSSLAWWVLRSRREVNKGIAVHDEASRRVLVVLPFENISKDRSRDYFSAGLTEEMNGQLSKVSALQVINRTALAKYRDPRASLHQIATDLGIGSAVIGSVRQEGSRVRIHLEIVDARNDRTLWSEQYDRELKDIFEVQTEAALRVADVLKARLSPNEQARIERRPTESIAAYELYLRAEELPYSDHQKNLSAVRMLQQALSIDPRFAMAEAALAYRMVFQAYWDKSSYVDSGMDMARKALGLDPDLAEAHVALALGYYLKGQGSNARLSLLKTIELNPNHGGAMMNLSLLESDTGHFDEALHWARRGFRLEPNSAVAYFHVGIPLLFLGDDAATESWLKKAEYLFPGSMRLQILLAILDFHRGRYQDASQRIRKAAAAQPRNEEVLNLVADLALTTGASDAESRVERLFRAAPT